MINAPAETVTNKEILEQLIKLTDSVTKLDSHFLRFGHDFFFVLKVFLVVYCAIKFTQFIISCFNHGLR